MQVGSYAALLWAWLGNGEHGKMTLDLSTSNEKCLQLAEADGNVVLLETLGLRREATTSTKRIREGNTGALCHEFT